MKIKFKDRPDFTPSFTPAEMFKMGIFGGSYFQIETDLPQDFIKDYETPIAWFKTPKKDQNLYGVISGSSLEWWLNQNLIHQDDPNGWVEWYIKFYYGRRHEDDDRQIKRFRSFVVRHIGMLRAYEAKGKDSAKTKQNLLQWGWDYRVNPEW